MKFLVSVQRSKGGKKLARPMIFQAEVDMDRLGWLVALGADRTIKLRAARVMLIGADGLLIEGMTPEDRYQEIWCRAIDPKPVAEPAPGTWVQKWGNR